MQQLVTIILCSLILCGCDELIPSQSPPAPAEMANPASVYCDQLGGVSQPYQTAEGAASNCKLPNGTLIEEWTLYRRDHSQQ